MLLSLHASPTAGLTRQARPVPPCALGSALDARLHALRASLPAASTLVLVLGFVMAAGLGAAVIATGNLVASGLILGALLGVLMLDAPALAVWIVLVGTLAVTGPLVMHQPQFARLAWLFSVLGMFLMAAALLHAATARRARHARAGLPGFVVLAAAVLIYALIGIPFSDGPPEEWMSGIKRQFQYWGLFFAFALVPFTQVQVNRWLRFLLVLGLLQLPFAIYQRIVLVPRRMNMPNEVVPVDIVAGTFEGSITGGANDNVMALFLVCVLLGLLAARREGLIRDRLLWPLAAVVMAPISLGETKMVLVLLPLGLAALYADAARRRPFAFTAGALATATLVAALFYSYVALQVEDGRAGMSFRQRFEQNVEYNVGQRGYYGGASLNRGNVVPFWWSRHGLNDPLGTVFGHGLGSAHGSRGTERLGHMDRRYPGYSIGLTSVATQLWEGGVLGATLFAAMLVAAWRTASRLIEQAASGADRALCRTLRAAVLLIVPMWLAMDMLLLAASLQVMMATVLGLIAWRWRKGAAPAAVPVFATAQRPVRAAGTVS
jgi:hypothetical protein